MLFNKQFDDDMEEIFKGMSKTRQLDTQSKDIAALKQEVQDLKLNQYESTIQDLNGIISVYEELLLEARDLFSDIDETHPLSAYQKDLVDTFVYNVEELIDDTDS